ncbi:group I truncated hemoglobin [Rhodovibrionaceae bacterium A322]
MSQTLFMRIGGFATVSRVVMDFYDRILDSEKAGDYFENIDIDSMINHQTNFVASLMGGPSAHTNEQLKRSHARLNIDDESFDEMIQILTATLSDHGLGADDVTAVIQEMESRRSLIVTRQ